MSVVSLFRKDSFVNVPYMIQRKLLPTVRALKDIFSFASTVFAEQLLMRFGFFMSAFLTAKLGTEVLAAHQVGMNAMSLSFSFGDGLQVAAVTLIGQNLRSFFVVFFPNEPQIVELGVSLIKFMILLVLLQISQVVFSGSLRGAGDVRFTTITSTISVAIVRPCVTYIAAYTLGLGITGIWVGILADQSVRNALSDMINSLGNGTNNHNWIKSWSTGKADCCG